MIPKIVLGFAIACVAGSVAAAPVTFKFTGTMSHFGYGTGLENELTVDPSMIGQPLVGTVTVDLNFGTQVSSTSVKSISGCSAVLFAVCVPGYDNPYAQQIVKHFSITAHGRTFQYGPFILPAQSALESTDSYRRISLTEEYRNLIAPTERYAEYAVFDLVAASSAGSWLPGDFETAPDMSKAQHSYLLMSHYYITCSSNSVFSCTNSPPVYNGGYGFSASIDSWELVSLDPNDVAEPSSIALFVLGAATLAATRRRVNYGRIFPLTS